MAKPFLRPALLTSAKKRIFVYMKKMGHRLLCTPWIWLRRFRNRRGYGVHSPFAFNFITGVVYEGGSYYAYSHLDKWHNVWVRMLRLRPLMCSRLLFRVANYVSPDELWMWKVSELDKDYLQSGCVSAQSIDAEEKTMDSVKNSGETKVVLLFIAAEEDGVKVYENLRERLAEGSAVVVEGIGNCSCAARLWNVIRQDERVGATFDLYDYGIAFYEPKRNNQHYVVNF